MDYGSSMFVTSKRNFDDLMTQHRIEEVYNVDNTKSLDLELSLEKPIATFLKIIGQHAFIVACVVVSMNFNNR